MKVKLKEIIDSVGKDSQDNKIYLTPGNVYQVLAIDIEMYNEKPSLNLRIMDDLNETPGRYSIDLFEIVSNKIPSSWQIEYNSHRLFRLEPGLWLDEDKWKDKHSFWEAYFDDDKEAILIFEQEKEKMELEDKN